MINQKGFSRMVSYMKIVVEEKKEIGEPLNATLYTCVLCTFDMHQISWECVSIHLGLPTSIELDQHSKYIYRSIDEL